MKPYIFTVRNDIHILDLEKTRKALLAAGEFAKKVASEGGTILFVGTKRQAKDAVKTAAEAAGMPYVNVRWLGGTFTNFRTIQKTIRKLEKLQELKASGELESKYTKKERLLMEREIDKLDKLFAGMKSLKRLPEVIFIADVNYDDIALLEAKKTGVKIIAVVDSNSNPVEVACAIPCNDDATQAITLVADYLAEAINEGRTQSIVTSAPVAAAVPAAVAPAAPTATP